MSTGDRNKALNVLGEHDKGKPTGATDRYRLNTLTAYLRDLPGYTFSEKGRLNICGRFGVSDAELTVAVAALQSPRPSQPTLELLDTISRAISRTNATGGASKW